MAISFPSILTTIANGTTTRFNTGYALTSPQEVLALVGGVPQTLDAYTVDGTDVVYNEAPPAGVRIEHRVATGGGTSTPTASDPLWSSVSVLIQPKSGTTSYSTDAKGNALTFIGNAAVNSGAGVFPGGGAILFDGSGDRLEFSSSKLLALNSVSAYTIEVLMRIDPDSAVVYRDIVGLNQSGSTQAVSLRLSGTGNLALGDWGSNGYPETLDPSAAPLNQTLYVAFVKNGNTASLYRNGTLVASRTLPSAVWTDMGLPATVFGRPAGGTDIKGRLYGLRITHAARTIVMPTALWPETGS